MAGVVFRRVLWGVVILGWPAVAVLRLAFHPAWGCYLTLAGAPAEAGCALLLRAGRAAARARGALDRETDRRLGDLEARAAAADGLGERVADLSAVLALAFGYAGVSVPASRRLRACAPGEGGVTRSPRRSRSASSSGRG